MGRYSSDKGGSFQSAPIGTHLGRCTKIIDIGTQKMEDFDGNPTKKNQVIIGWELPDELMSDGKPFVISKFYTNSLHKKASLRHDLEQWRGRAFSDEELKRFDLAQIIGKACMVSIIAKPAGNGTKVSSVTALPRGMNVPDQVNQSVIFWLDEFNQTIFDGLSDGLKKLIEKSDEFRAMQETGETGEPAETHLEPVDDEVPF